MLKKSITVALAITLIYSHSFAAPGVEFYATAPLSKPPASFFAGSLSGFKPDISVAPWFSWSSVGSYFSKHSAGGILIALAFPFTGGVFAALGLIGFGVFSIFSTSDAIRGVGTIFFSHGKASLTKGVKVGGSLRGMSTGKAFKGLGGLRFPAPRIGR